MTPRAAEGAPVTVVMPVRNRADRVEAALRSVAAQAPRPRIIVVDNGSSDATPQLLQKLQREIPFDLLEEPQPGACRARNRGLMKVTTPYVMFFDSDDLMLPGHVERMITLMEGHAGAALVTAPVMTREENTGACKQLRWEPDLRQHLAYATLSTQRWMARTQLVRDVGGWHEGLEAWNDWELGVRLLLSGATMAAAPRGSRPLVTQIAHADSITGVRYSDRPERRHAALDAVEALLAGKRELPLAHAVRATLAAHYRREGARDDARAQLREALAKGKTMRERAILRLIYHTVRLTGHGSSKLMLAFL